MKRTYIEKRIIRASRDLNARRIELEGTKITKKDIEALKVKTFSPILQIVYCLLGAILSVFGLWVQLKLGNMAVAMGLVLVGFLNVAFAVNGKPQVASRIEGVDIDALAKEILESFGGREGEASS